MEGYEMFTIRSRAIAAVAAAAFALTAFSTAPANAGTRRGDAVALAAIAGLFGTIAAVAAANAARDRHPGYYRPYPVAPYAGAQVYRGPVHHGPRWSGWHRRHWQR
jgi:hypothetical protein